MRAGPMHAASCRVLALLALGHGGCGDGERTPLPGAQNASPPRVSPAPSQGPGSAPAEALEQDEALPLKLEGIGGAAELHRALAKLEDPEARARFELGFRSCFVKDSARRAYHTALRAMEDVLRRVPDFAPAYRVMAYARFNLSFDMAGARELYEKAVQADPDYGEAHYALSFILTQLDPELGREHFERAMELGVPDERNLGGRFYP